MKKTNNLFLVVSSVLLTFQLHAQSPYVQRLAIANRKITAAWLHHDATALLSVYADEAVSMREYHLTLFGKEAIGSYLRKWMDSAVVSSYIRRTHDVTKTGDFLVETGTFWSQFSFRGKAINYEGKYLDIWQIKPGGGLQLISEITGATKNLERADLPLSTLQIPDTTLFPKPKTDQTTVTIQSLDDQVAELVIQHRGKDFAKYYTNDAIYMPYYMPMLIGKAPIDAYYRRHEDPNTGIDAVHIRASRIIETAGYVLVDGYYRVAWRVGNAHGTVTGKNISVWKRSPNGKLLLFRQMVVHD